MRPLARLTDGLVGQPLFQLMQDADDLARGGRDVLHFELGGLDCPPPPAAVGATKAALDASETGYGDSRGLLEFREAIARHVKRELGFRPSLGQILACPANAAVEFLVRCVANPGDEVIIPDPCFPTYPAVLSYLDIASRSVELGRNSGFDMDPMDLARQITSATRLIITNSPSNPTGACLSAKSVAGIAVIAEENDCLLLSDEVYAAVAYDGQHHSPGVIDSCLERTVILGSMSKSHAMAGWRLGFLVGPEAIIEKVGLLLQSVLLCLPTFTQQGGAAALAEGDRFARQIRPILRKRRDRLVRGLNDLAGLECGTPEGGFFAFPHLSEEWTDDVTYARQLLEEEAVCAVPGSYFGAAGAGFLRFSYAASPLSVIDRALERLHRFHTKHFERPSYSIA